MSLAALRAAIMEAEAALPPDDVPDALGVLEAARARLLRRMVEAAARPREVRLLTVDEASDLARLPRRRIYSLSRGAAWAVRVGRKLLVEESAFRRALAPGSDVRGAHEPARAAVPGQPDPALVHVRARQSHAKGLVGLAKLRA